MDGPSPEHPDTIIARIADRRERAGGRHLETMPADAAGVIRWVTAHLDAPPAVLRADVLDCFALDYWLQVTLPRRRLALYHLARRPAVGVTWRQIADAQHLGTPQAAQMAKERLEAARGDVKKDEKAIRAKRRSELSREIWLDEHADDIREAARALVAAAADGAPEVAEILDDPDSTIKMLMAWTAVELRGHPPGLCPATEDLAAEWDDLFPR